MTLTQAVKRQQIEAAKDKVISALRMALLAPQCPLCGRNNSEYRSRCTADDCEGVQALRELDQLEKE